jgi:polysaccharide biosynthesis protein PslF
MPGPLVAETIFSDPRRSPRSFGILSTYPPTECGIATFSAALSTGLVGEGHSVDVVRVGTAAGLDDPLVVASLGGDPSRWATAREALERTDVAIIQHEYGIYPGADGEGLVPFLEALKVPVVVVAHTILEHPTRNQRRVLCAACATADAVVVMTRHGRQRLVDGYDVDPRKIHVIPHGAATPVTSSAPRRSARQPRLLTWGLLGPGKGIEWAIDALAILGGERTPPQYVVAGATHPKVKAGSGEAYRTMLIQRAWASGVAARVVFDDTYLDLPALTDLIVSADVVVLPYDSEDQVTSGVLVDAVAAGRPVISTSFPHAVELLGSGAGMVVPQRDVPALAGAIRSVLDDPDLARGMAAEATRLAPGLSWVAVGEQYVALTGAVLADRAAVTR